MMTVQKQQLYLEIVTKCHWLSGFRRRLEINVIAVLLIIDCASSILVIGEELEKVENGFQYTVL